MSDQSETSRLVTAVFRAWQQAQLRFLVLRNYEDLPGFTSNDIDVLLDPGQLPKAEKELIEAAHAIGFRLHNRAEFATLALYLSSPASNVQVHFDLFTTLKWRSFDFLECDGFLDRRRPRELLAIPHPADEAATNLMAYLVYTGRVKEKYKASIAAGFRSHPHEATALLSRGYGTRIAHFLVQAGANEKWEAIEAQTGRLRRTLIRRQVIRRPGRALISLGVDASRLIKRWLRPPGLSVVLCGADGSGKSTVADAITKSLSGTFSPAKERRFHWKPPVFSRHRQASRTPVIDPHGQPPRNPAASVLFFCFHWLEFLLGSVLRIRPVTFRGGLVLIDRYYYDFFVDQRRYRLLVPEFFIRCGCSFLRKPDLALLLDAPAEVLQRRKQEVTLGETRRQSEAYRELFRGLPNGRILDAARSPDEVAVEATAAILDFMAARTSTRLGSNPAPSITVSTGQVPAAPPQGNQLSK